MDWTAVGCSVAIIGMMGAMFKWFYARLDKRFEQIDKRFEQIDKRFDRIDVRFDEIDKDLDAIRIDLRLQDARLSRMEGQDEERFRLKLTERMTAGKR